MKFNQLCFFITTILSLSSASVIASPVYNVQDGLLMGINNLDINGTAYDVTFRDGVFQDIFNLAEPFIFTTGNEASNASRALSIAMIDTPQGAFDSDPLLTFGCAGDNCQIRTAYEFGFGFVTAEWFRNAALDVDDERGGLDFLPTYDSTGNAVVFADWRISTVPVPAAVWLFGSGLMGLVGVARRKKS